MKLHLYSIYDKIACIFNKPFTEVNNGSAIRSFDQSIQENLNIKDYELYVVAVMDDNNGEVDGVKVECIRKGLDLANDMATEVTEQLKQVNK